MNTGSLVYFYEDNDKEKRLYIVTDIEDNPFNYSRARINVVCCRTTNNYWFFRHEMRELKNYKSENKKWE